MAVLSLTVPDAQVARLVAAVAQQRGVDVSSMNVAQKIAMMKADVIAYWGQLVQAAELPAVQLAADTAAVNTHLANIAANLTVT